ncbi:hypothetical protein L1887_39633 [Cichorium endivia]|nr:hypothetical protein L1887_39633 [Cichorium endivia]
MSQLILEKAKRNDVVGIELRNRVKACRVRNSMSSKIGRLKRSGMPRLDKGSTVFGSGLSGMSENYVLHCWQAFV